MTRSFDFVSASGLILTLTLGAATGMSESTSILARLGIQIVDQVLHRARVGKEWPPATSVDRIEIK